MPAPSEASHPLPSAEPPRPTTHEVRVAGGVFIASRPCTLAERQDAQAMVTRVLVGLDAGPLPPPFVTWELRLFWAFCEPHPDPYHEGQPVEAAALTETAVQVRLSSIAAGWIIFDISAGEQTVRCFLDPYLQGQLSDLVRFAQLLQDRAFPFLWCNDHHQIITRPVAGTLDGSPLLALDVANQDIQVIVDRRVLLAQWRAFCTAIAEAEHLAHKGVLHSSLPSTVVDDQADAAWQRLVAAGTPNDEEARELFTGTYIARRIRLTTRQKAYVEAERQMLRTLVIPAEWPSLIGPDGHDEEAVEILAE